MGRYRTVQCRSMREQGSQGRQRWLIHSDCLNQNNHRYWTTKHKRSQIFAVHHVACGCLKFPSHLSCPAQSEKFALNTILSSGDSGSMRQCVTFTKGYPVLCTTVHKMTNAEEVDTQSTLSVFFTRKLWFSRLRV